MHKSLYVHFLNKFPSAKVELGESSVAAYSPSGELLMHASKNGLGVVVDSGRDRGAKYPLIKASGGFDHYETVVAHGFDATPPLAGVVAYRRIITAGHLPESAASSFFSWTTLLAMKVAVASASSTP